MKGKAISPAMIIGAVVVLVIIVYGIYALSFRPQGGPPPKAENAPAYARQMGQGQRPAAPYGPQSGGSQSGGPPARPR